MIERLPRGVHAGAVGGIDRMQRLDRQRHVCRRAHSPASRRCRPRPAPARRRYPWTARCPAANIAAGRRPPARCRARRAPSPRRPRGGCRRAPRAMRGVGGEHAAAAIARQLQPGIAHRARRAVEADGGDLVAPGIDGADAMARAGVDDLQQIALLADGRRVERQPAMIGRKIPHQASMPRVASTAFMRRVASSGLASSPALSASRNSSARCSVERALSCPPTMVK